MDCDDYLQYRNMDERRRFRVADDLAVSEPIAGCDGSGGYDTSDVSPGATGGSAG